FELCFLFVFAAYTFTEVFFAATPGKMILRLRIGSSDGTPADGWRLLLRWSTKQFALLFQMLFNLTGIPLFYLLGGFGGLVVLIGCLYASNDDKQAWHDQWAGTAVF